MVIKRLCLKRIAYLIKTLTPRHDIGHAQLVHIQLFLVDGEVKCAVAAREAQDSTIYLGGVAERLTVAFHLFIGAFTQEVPLLEAELIVRGFNFIFSCCALL